MQAAPCTERWAPTTQGGGLHGGGDMESRKKKKSAHQDRAAKMEDLKTTGERGKQRWRSPALSTGLAQG